MLSTLANRLFPDQLRRDLQMLLRGLRGDQVSPFVTRSRPQHGERSAVDGHRRRLVISEVRRETSAAVSLVLRDPSGGAIPFECGQFFTLAATVGGETIKRAYSASSSALDTESVAVTIKRVEGGRMSNHLNDFAKAGESIDVLGPSGSFTPPSWENDLVLIGGGSGVTPLMSIARTVLASRKSAKVSMVFGNRSDEDIIFARELAELSARHEGRFELRHVLEIESASVPSRVGRLDDATLDLELAEATSRSSAMFFICGPEPVMAAAERVLAARAVPRSRVKVERFTSLRAATAATVPEEVGVLVGGARRMLTVAPGETILEAAMRSEVELPFSCTVGGCGACRVRLVSGDVVLDEPNCLDADERRDGYVLSCVARPLGPATIEVE
jgi:ferredoxin-NADP reductase